MSEDAHRPRATLEDVWRERDAWALEAGAGKKRQTNARLAALCLGVTGAFLGTLAGLVSGFGADWSEAATALGISSAIMIAIGGYMGRELLTPERETGWARARLLAEALQRECWLYQMRVPPYDDERSHEALRARAEEMARNRGLERPPVRIDAGVEPPVAGTVEEYLEQRALKQASWYEKTSGKHRAERNRLNTVALSLGAGTVVLGIVGSSGLPASLAFVPVLTTATAACVAWIQGGRVGSMIPLYQETSSQLRFQATGWRDGVAQRAALSPEAGRAAETRLVENCEEIMARENGAWRAEWLSEEKVQEAAAAVNAVQGAVGGDDGTP